MRLRPDVGVYERIWATGKSSNLGDLHGLYHVEVATGWIINKKNWRKFIHNPFINPVIGEGGETVPRRHSDQEDVNEVSGYNLKGNGKHRFGDFKASLYAINIEGTMVAAIKLRYTNTNKRWGRYGRYTQIDDIIVEIIPGLYLGRFFLGGKFQGWFWMVADDFSKTNPPDIRTIPESSVEDLYKKKSDVDPYALRTESPQIPDIDKRRITIEGKLQ